MDSRFPVNNGNMLLCWSFTALRYFLRSFGAWSVNLSTLFLGKPPVVYQYLVPILLPVADNCPS